MQLCRTVPFSRDPCPERARSRPCGMTHTGPGPFALWELDLVAGAVGFDRDALHLGLAGVAVGLAVAAAYGHLDFDARIGARLAGAAGVSAAAEGARGVIAVLVASALRADEAA